MATSPYVPSGSGSDDSGDDARQANTSQALASSGSDAESEVEPDGQQMEPQSQMPADDAVVAVVDDGLNGTGASTATSIDTRYV